jgi:RNA polymerase sigma-70 factor, ECF subfamily
MVGKPWEIDLSVYDDEAALLTGLRSRERLACTCLLKRYAPPLYHLALRLVGDPDEAEDVLQEAFIRACDHVAEFEGRSGLGTWLHRIVMNTALMHLRRRNPSVLRLDEPQDDGAADLAARLTDGLPGPGEEALSAELRANLERALLALPDTLRATFVLRDLEGLSTREAAAALGITESALKVRLHRAHQSLRAALAPYLRQEDAPPLAPPVESRLMAQLCRTA